MKAICLIDTFNFSTDKEQEKKQQSNIYKCTQHDMIHAWIHCTLEDKLAGPFTHIFNNAAGTGIIPEDFKSAIVTATHKKGSRQEPGYYRPISLTCVVCMQEHGAIS